MRLACYTAILTAVLLAGALPRWAAAGEAVEVEVAKSISDPGLELLAAGAVVLPLFENGGAGRNETLRTADTLVVTAVACRALKAVVREPRPDGRGNDSFPSSHAALAFAAATMAAERQPRQAAYWYGGAALIAWSRVRVNRHRPREVLAGAALGFGIARLERRMPRGLLLAPFFDSELGTGVEARFNF